MIRNDRRSDRAETLRRRQVRQTKYMTHDLTADVLASL